MLDLDRFDAWTERSNALRAGASRRIWQKVKRTLAVVTVMLVMLALWPATGQTPQPARATTPHGFIIQKGEQIITIMQRRAENPPPPAAEDTDCALCEYVMMMLLALCKQNPIWCFK